MPPLAESHHPPDSLPALGATSDHVAALAARGSRRRFRRGALIIQEGDYGDTMFVVVSGRLRAFVADASGKELTLGLYGPGEYVGEMSLDGGPRSANVEATETTECTVITRDQLLAYIAEHPDFALELLARLIRRARTATDNARSVALTDVYGRLVRLLDQLALPPDGNGHRTLSERLTHQQVANHLACSREMVSRLVKDLEQGGYLTTDAGRRMVLLRPLPARW